MIAVEPIDRALESIPEGEAEAIAQLVAWAEQTVRSTYTPNNLPARRDAHVKHHGCVRAEFRVGEDVPPDLRHGVLAEPGAFDAWVRFSNATEHTQADDVDDVRGMAIKLTGVPGDKLLDDERHTQDFLLINAPFFFIRDAQEYVEFTRHHREGQTARYFVSLNPLKWHLREGWQAYQLTQGKMSNPITSRYWSATPYKLGPHAVKLSARPVVSADPEAPTTGTYSFLYEALRDTLAQRDVEYEFLVQLRQGDDMPIEDPSKQWSEEDSPFIKVASLHFPRQVFDSPAQMTFAEHLSFNPWHSLIAHAPLGGINRIRREIYRHIAALRRELNAVTPTEPTGKERFE